MDTGKLINKISIRLRRRSEKDGEKSRNYRGSGGGFWILSWLTGRDRPLYQKDIEKEFGLRPSTAMELLKTLESRKMIQRVSSERMGDKKIQLTEAAEDIRLALQQGRITRRRDCSLRESPSEDLNTFMEGCREMLRT